MSETRAKVSPPPKKRAKSYLPEAQKSTSASDNMKGEELKGMTFNMKPEWHARFKMTAAMRGISMHQLLLECFEAYEKSQKDK